MSDHSAPHASKLPPFLILTALLLEIACVYSVERWLLRDGLSPVAVHAEKQLKAEMDMRFRQGVLMLHAKQYEHAMTAFHRVLQLEPDMPEAHVNLGFALLGMNNFAEARDFFAEALAIRAEQTNAHYGLALAMDGLGERHEAVEAMYRYVTFAPPGDPYRQQAEALLARWREDLRQRQAAAHQQKGKKIGVPPRHPSAAGDTPH